MSKRLARNYDDINSKRLWEAAEKAAANRRKLVVPEISIEAKGDQAADTKPANASQAGDAEKET